jgi:hypothetical protein
MTTLMRSSFLHEIFESLGGAHGRMVAEREFQEDFLSELQELRSPS